ncbi:hypothetical protein BUALT_Bualt10G0024700 [Buddleja alternifolia]|uniref:Uncharacterized protein n=1 Tax=Buddleja alternifolia TaxID=168488 RepID=A0AAV6WVI4_9LAMI|nr:hypothetical protein BUALT_Bualt10G0024700 [Buddleja alternifolia]
MAKKKVSNSHSEKPLQNQDDFVKPHHQQATATMDSDASEKIESLKSLNQMLLKEAVERRQQVDSLILSKGSLESELTTSNSERETLKSELTQLSERAARLELERSVVAVFVAVQAGQKGEAIERKMKGLESEMIELKRVVNEKECEIGRLNGKLTEIEDALGSEKEVSRRVCVERDGLMDELDLKIEEEKGLRADLIEFEGRKREIEREIGELRVAYNSVVGESKERGVMVESVTREKDLMERSLVESGKLIEEMKDQLLSVVREKERIEGEKNVEMLKRQALEDAVSGLHEMVVGLQKEEEKLRANVAVLEKNCVEGEERQKDMIREIDQLVKEWKLSEKSLEGLRNEKGMIEKDLGEALKQLDDQRCKIEDMVNEKIVLLEAKGRVDIEVGELQNKVGALKAVVLKLEESSRVQLETIVRLESEVGEFRCKLEQVKVERDGIENCLSEEKNNGARLKEKIVELENQIHENLKAGGEAKAKYDATFAEKIEFESQCGLLKKEITRLENTIKEARNEFDLMKGKVEVADSNAELMLKMLKDTSALCSKDGSYACDDKQINGEETKAYVIEMEMIKNAFKSKESKVENMKRQLELLQKSLEEAHKKKSFWTVLSSATTLLAAVSLAYVTRGH